MIRILITSVGGQVGQNILDVLEIRRNFVEVLGINSIAESHGNFRCDKIFLVPPTEKESLFEKAFEEILNCEQPDIILAGRDIDVLFLAGYKEKHPEIGHRFVCGNSSIAQIMYDKHRTYQYAVKNNLPFADTFLYSERSNQDGLNEFIAKHRFPLIVKPRRGCGSQNVFFLTNFREVKALIKKEEEALIQEYLCPDENFDKYLANYKKGMPLFFQVNDNNHYVSQVVISPDQKVVGVFNSRHTMISGKAESSVVYENEKVDMLVRAYVDALILAGWIGFLNIQFKPDRDGCWKVFEINSRMAGASSSRFLLGFDELGLMIKSFFPDLDFPVFSGYYSRPGTVLKFLTDHFLYDRYVTELNEKKSWVKANALV